MKRIFACPVCLGREWELLIDFGKVPRSGVFYNSEESAVSLRDLSFIFCARCAFIVQKPEREPIDYIHVDRDTRSQLPHYLAELIGRLALPKRFAELVVEVGANDGTFLTRLGEHGFTQRLGIEPSAVLARACKEAGHAVENAYLTHAFARQARATYGLAHTIVCRHTLEHVADPVDFLKGIRELLHEDGSALIEVPGSRTIIEELKGFELWEEHLSLFSPRTLVRLLCSQGFEIISCAVYPHLKTENIVCIATRANRLGKKPWEGEAMQEVSKDLALCRSFAERSRAYAASMQKLLNNAPRPVFAMGASHPQSNYLLFAGLGADIAALIDDDPGKIERFLALPEMKPVYPTNVLPDCMKNGGTILLTAFGYQDWHTRVREMLSGRNVQFIDPLEELARFSQGVSRV